MFNLQLGEINLQRVSLSAIASLNHLYCEDNDLSSIEFFLKRLIITGDNSYFAASSLRVTRSRIVPMVTLVLKLESDFFLLFVTFANVTNFNLHNCIKKQKYYSSAMFDKPLQVQLRAMASIHNDRLIR